MELRFWNDPETSEPHIFAHGVTEEEVRQVLSRPGLDYPEKQNARGRLGQTAAGRLSRSSMSLTRVAMKEIRP